jgi:hypothetical protein
VIFVKVPLSVIGLTLTLALPLTAGAIEIKTGKWEVKMQSVNPVTGQPINETLFECIKDKNFDPAQAMMEDGLCRIIDKREINNSVSWKIQCGGGGMPTFSGEGSFISHGDSAEGEMHMVMTMGETTIEMRNNWSGRRVSAKCDGR